MFIDDKGRRTMTCFIGLDLGTTSVKALLFDERGNLLGAADVEDALSTPHPGWIEQNAEHWVELSAEVIRKAVREAGVDPGEVSALSISSQGITCVPVDRGFKPLRDAINWLDQRAADEMDEVVAAVGLQELYGITGKSPYPGYTLPVIMWLKRNEPEVFEDTHKFLLPHDFLCARFCGAPVTDHTMAGGTMLYDVPTQQWSDRLLGLFGIDRGLLPELRWAGEPAGHLTKEASALLGLPEKTLVATGGQDQKVAAYGANLGLGSVTISLGTCAAMEFLFDHAPSHPARSLAACSYLWKDAWVLEACINTACGAIKWARNALFHDLSYDGIDSLAASCETSGGVFFYPYLQGSGTPYNIPACGAFTGLTLGATRAELARAVLEGVAMEIRANLDSAGEAGMGVERIGVFGGGSKSRVLCQMIADAAGRSIQAFTTPEMGAFGAAKLAAGAVGIMGFAPPVGEKWEPDAGQNARYNELYSAYQKSRESILALG